MTPFDSYPTAGFFTPVVANGDLYTAPRAGDDTPWATVDAFDPTTGTPIWTAPTTDSGGIYSLAYANGYVYESGEADNDAFNAATGAYAGGGDGVYGGAITAAGSQILGGWGNSITSAAAVGATNRSWGYFFPSTTNRGSESQGNPAVTGGLVFGASGQYLVALSQLTGSRKWIRSIDTTCYCLSAPTAAYGGQTVYAGGGALYALAGATGKTIWAQKALSSVGTPAEAYGTLYMNVRGENPGLYAVNASNGKVLWHDSGVGVVADTPTVANGVVYDIDHGGRLLIFNSATGELLRTISDPHGLPFDSTATGQPVINAGYLYLTTVDSSSIATEYLDAFTVR